ncbi:MAG: RidA family protein [Candidatus Obscuribacterales bacterium]|nr:RidA family protein [Candidatus Obscuribacterales bacterium]
MKVVATDSAPKAIGPYSQAVVANGMIFVSGQIPIDPATGNLVDGPIADQTKQVMSNLAAILESAGADFSKVVKTTVYLKDMGDFAEMNEVYGNHFPENKPARATVQVAKLPRDVSVEIDCIAVL